MKEDLTKLFRGIPGYELVQERPKNVDGMTWEGELPGGTLVVMEKMEYGELDYVPICWLVPLDAKDEKIRALEAELAAYRAKEPLYDPNDVRFEPRGPELADCEDDGA